MCIIYAGEVTLCFIDIIWKLLFGEIALCKQYRQLKYYNNDIDVKKSLF